MVLAADSVEVSRDEASFPLVAPSFYKQSSFLRSHTLQGRQYPSKCLVAFTLVSPLPFLSLSLTFSTWLFSLVSTLPSPLPFACLAFLAFAFTHHRESHGYHTTSSEICLCSATMTPVLTCSSRGLPNLCSYLSLSSQSHLSAASVVCAIDSRRFGCNKYYIRSRWRP